MKRMVHFRFLLLLFVLKSIANIEADFFGDQRWVNPMGLTKNHFIEFAQSSKINHSS